MSDSETSDTVPNETTIEAALRDAVREAAKEEEEVTVKLVRTRAEEKLGLDTGYLKDNAAWRVKSASIIKDAFDQPSSPEKPKKSAPKAKAGAKRKSDDSIGATRKRRKKSPVADSEGDVGEHSISVAASDASEQEPSASTKPQSLSTSALSSAPGSDEEEVPKLEAGGKVVASAADDDESELSSVVDNAPPKKKRQKKSDSQPTKSKPAKSSKVANRPGKPGKELSPDDEEIKRLQGWLVKCGIRKLWHRELATCNTGKEKIKHLKGMLEDAGMTGRYSAEKAKQIKEQRELKEEIEAAKQFNDKWGQEKDGESDDEAMAPRRSRLKPKGLVDFGDSGEDSD